MPPTAARRHGCRTCDSKASRRASLDGRDTFVRIETDRVLGDVDFVSTRHSHQGRRRRTLREHARLRRAVVDRSAARTRSRGARAFAIRRESSERPRLVRAHGARDAARVSRLSARRARRCERSLRCRIRRHGQLDVQHGVRGERSAFARPSCICAISATRTRFSSTTSRSRFRSRGSRENSTAHRSIRNRTGHLVVLRGFDRKRRRDRERPRDFRRRRHLLTRRIRTRVARTRRASRGPSVQAPLDRTLLALANA